MCFTFKMFGIMLVCIRTVSIYILQMEIIPIHGVINDRTKNYLNLNIHLFYLCCMLFGTKLVSTET